MYKTLLCLLPVSHFYRDYCKYFFKISEFVEVGIELSYYDKDQNKTCTLHKNSLPEDVDRLPYQKRLDKKATRFAVIFQYWIT